MNKSVAKLSGEPLVTYLTTKERRVVDEDCEEVSRVDRELDRLFKEFWHGSEHDMASVCWCHLRQRHHCQRQRQMPPALDR